MITAQVESVRGVLEEIKPLLAKHYDKLSLHQGRFALEPIWQAYLDEEARGENVVVTLRRDGALVGYWIAVVRPGRHYASCLTAGMDIWFVDPSVGGKGPLVLARAVEKELRRRGVRQWLAVSKLHRDSGPFLQRLGFEPIEVVHSKWLD